MNIDVLPVAIREAEEFIRRAKLLKASRYEGIVGTSLSGSVRRQSLELTRALALLRKPRW